MGESTEQKSLLSSSFILNTGSEQLKLSHLQLGEGASS